MILETMTLDQACAEARADAEVIRTSSTLSRLQDEYLRARQKAKVPNSQTWKRRFMIKTKRKNTWMILIDKVPGRDKAVWCTMLVYFYTSKGIRAISVNSAKDFREGFIVVNSHAVKRWNERLGKGIVQPMDMIEAFFDANAEVVFKLLRNEEEEVFGVVDGGFLLGNKHGKNVTVVNTFINRELAGRTQLQYEESIRATMQEDLDRSRPAEVEVQRVPKHRRK
jgi:hypothetical protein